MSLNTQPFSDFLGFKKEFDVFLTAFCADQITHYKHILSAPHDIISRIRHAHDIMLNGGKRVRPYLINLAAYNSSLKEEDIMHISACAELIHAVALLVDDIIDEGAMRHKTQTLHTKLIADGQKPVMSHMQTVLVSDLMYNHAFKALLTRPLLALGQCHEVISEFHMLLDEVIIGEMIDADLQWKADAPASLITMKNNLKTASYTFTRPLLLGAKLSNASIETCKQLEHIGFHLWTAYQIMDDILDVTWWYDDKTVFSDMQEGQQNTITSYFFSHATAEQKEEFLAMFGKKLDNWQIARLTSLFHETGTIEANRSLFQDHSQAGHDMIAQLDRPDEQKEHLESIVEMMTLKLEK